VLIVRAISFQDFNLCGHDPPTSQTDRRTNGQTDRQTDDMRSQNRALHYSASRGKTLASFLAVFDLMNKVNKQTNKQTCERVNAYIPSAPNAAHKRVGRPIRSILHRMEPALTAVFRCRHGPRTSR